MPIDLYFVQSTTQRNRDAVAETMRRVEDYNGDYRIYDRQRAQQCAYCFYFRSGRLVGQAFTEWTCRLCDEKQPMWSNTGHPTLCTRCAVDHRLCVQCGGDVEMKRRSVL